jgi:cardiolipin synthase
MSWSDAIEPYWELITAGGAILGPVLSVATIAWVLVTKKNSTSAVAWCLLIFFLPLLGPLVFLLFGYQHVSRPLSRKRKQRRMFQTKHSARAELGPEAVSPTRDADLPTPPSAPDREDLGRLARRFGAFPMTSGNQLHFYHEGKSAFDAMLETIRSAQDHVHLETFILQADATGQLFLDTLARKARQGVEVRLLYDAMGTRRRARRMIRALSRTGVKGSVFLPLNLLRRRIQVNMRNHRKILVVDGRVGFVGGLNIGDEYLGKVERYGFWRDTHLRLEGPALAGLQLVFMEDWDFAAHEYLQDPRYLPSCRADGPHDVQVIDSGPDREQKGIRELYFAAILRAKERVWIASPYFVPDAGLLDALCLAGYLGVDVRLLGLFHPDKWIPYFAGRYYWNDVLAAGVKVYQYTKGMMHAKVVLVDDDWASVGTANMDNRSLYLNFEVNCLIHSSAAVASLEEAMRRDLRDSIRLDRHVYARRPLPSRLLDNACRLLSPVL